jgi:hypothetical protein
MPNGFGHEVGFGMRGWIAVGENGIFRCKDDFTIQRQECAKRMVSLVTSLPGQRNRLSHEWFVHALRCHVWTGLLC